jgi:hypothetical protein
MLANDILNILSAAGHDLNSSNEDIEDVSKTLEPMVFEFQTPAEAMTWMCEIGDGQGNPLAWGVRPDRRKMFYLETQDTSEISYYIQAAGGAASVGVAGDLQESHQQVRGVYEDSLGRRQLTAWQSDTDAYFEGHYRRKSVTLDNIDNDTDAVELAQMYLEERKVPKLGTKYKVSHGGVKYATGRTIPIDELVATGKTIVIQGLRNSETGMGAGQLRIEEQLIGVEIDYDAGTANLIPASARSDFERYMAELARIAER